MRDRPSLHPTTAMSASASSVPMSAATNEGEAATSAIWVGQSSGSGSGTLDPPLSLPPGHVDLMDSPRRKRPFERYFSAPSASVPSAKYGGGAASSSTARGQTTDEHEQNREIAHSKMVALKNNISALSDRITARIKASSSSGIGGPSVDARSAVVGGLSPLSSPSRRSGPSASNAAHHQGEDENIPPWPPLVLPTTRTMAVGATAGGTNSSRV